MTPQTAVERAVASLNATGADRIKVEADHSRITARSAYRWNAAPQSVFIRVEPTPAGSRVDCTSTARSDVGWIDLGQGRITLKRLVAEFREQNADSISSDSYLGHDSSMIQW